MSGVDLTDQFLYSVALEWDEPPVPSDSPITGYNISVLPVDSGRQVPPPCLSRRNGCLWTHTIQFLVGCFFHLCNSIHLPGFNCTLSALGSHFPFPAECSVSEGKLFLKYCISFLLVSIIVILHDKAFPAIGYY